MVPRTETWFIPVDLLMIFSTALAVLFAVTFLLTILLHRTWHTVSMMLIANSCFAEVIFAGVMFSMAVSTFRNDLHGSRSPDSFCVARGFLGYVATVLQNYSYLLQACYRYIVVVHPNRLFWQSAKFQTFLIALTWLFGFFCAVLYASTGEIKYDLDNQICQMPLQYSFLTFLNPVTLYVIPILLIMSIYMKLVIYVREMNTHVTPVNTSLRGKRECRMVRRIVILVSGITILGFPYTTFCFISLFTTPPKYHFRIAYIFVDLSLLFVISALFQFTESLKTFFWRRSNERGDLFQSVVPPV